MPCEFLQFLGTADTDCIYAGGCVLIDPIFTEIDCVILNCLELDAGSPNFQSSGYSLPTSLVDAPHFSMCSCLCMAVGKMKSGSRY